MLAADGDQLALRGGGGEYFMPWHWHDCLMLFLPRIGAVDFRDETRKSGAWLSEDRFVVVRQSLAHQTAAARIGNSHLAIYASDDQLARIEARIGSLSRVRAKLDVPAFFAVTPEMRSLQSLCHVSETDDMASRAVQGHIAAALLIKCLAQIERSEQLSAACPEGHGEALIAEIKSFITKNATSDLPLDAIAEFFGLSRRHATRLFREKTSMSIAEFHERERVRQARDLLVETSLPVGEVAWRVGFESGSSLARTMRRVTGLTPTDVRKSMARTVKT
ncbi:AraC family transcriptional regulator [Xanthobacter sp. VTT E-85241]|uniref:AraC family transcriptional regulator n=1 Tax=Roseixanthobacter finlandensis TaxID=3119922 RepID=UPI002CC9A989|nr:AraC family transcriptional regulator [Xanthobacteraceae bacterium]